MTVSFVIHGAPRGKGRPRFGVRNGHAFAYTDEKTKAYEKAISLSACAVMAGREPMAAAVWARIDVFVSIPKSTPKYRVRKMLAGEERPAKKPDQDNIIKAVLDGMNRIVFVDDAQVVALGSQKFYSAEPRVEVTVGEVTNAQTNHNGSREASVARKSL